MSTHQKLKVAIGGVGAIGLKVAKMLDAGEIPDLMLSAVAARDQDKLRHNLRDYP